MNIRQAKEQIKNAVTAYFAKDEFGLSRIPAAKQRPIILMGPPGIGKTAVMEQVASELGVGLVSYSMTHHTRQSALGLPFIVKEEYKGFSYDMSEYTMSEIIGSIYRLMRESGVEEGILFLDEINCVSETLAPCMLQFLQYKVFGQHRVPDGWIVVTAGNPPEYNKSVRDFDIVTWDRLKRIDVEPDYAVWRDYAVEKGLHPAVLTYLSSRKDDFYIVESTAGGKAFVTARGWEDLSDMMVLSEEKGLPVDEELIIQYLQHPRVAKDFAIYYDLYRKYRDDYRIPEILDGSVSDGIAARAAQAPFDERISLMGMLFSAVAQEMRDAVDTEDMMTQLKQDIRKVLGQDDIPAALQEAADACGDALERGARASSMSRERRKTVRRIRAKLLSYKRASDDDALRACYMEDVEALSRSVDTCREHADNAFRFCEKAFGEGEEILILVTELTADRSSSTFIARHGCGKYFEHNQALQFGSRQKEILQGIAELEQEEGHE